MKNWLLAFFSLGLLACDKLPESVDFAISAHEGGDWTAVMEGCSQGLQNGYLFCRVRQGSAQDFKVTLHVPKINCDRNSCVDITWIDLDGNNSGGAGIPIGKTSQSFDISEITGDSTLFSKSHDGEYRVLIRAWWKNEDGEEFSMKTKGALRILVLGESYSQLNCNDPERGWKHKAKRNCNIETSTGYRTALCGQCGEKVEIPK